ncbi:hypothetical protein ACMGDH_05440 [Sphingomonas sp. DT-207]|uniref:hypothetical protein n=1 Tax=Sphingomonas sp. DT-207 TaxID=3396167 RepID=UPI003F1DBAF8
MKLIAIAAAVAIGPSLAASVNANDVDRVISKLDLTTFPNSLPKRMPGKTTFADYGFITVAKTASGAKLVGQIDGASKSFVVVSNHPKHMRLCFHDGVVRQLGATARRFDITSALLVTKSQQGAWTAEEVPGGFPNCRNGRAAT